MSHITSMLAGSPVMARQGFVRRYGRAGSVSDGGSAFGDSSCRLNVGEDALAVAYYGDTTMATADHTTSEKRMSKTVNIVCYLKVDSDVDKRELMDRLDDTHDYYKTDTKSRSKFYAFTRDGVMRINEEEAEMLSSAEGEDLAVREKVTERENYPNGKYTFTNVFSSNVLAGIDKSPPSLDVEYEFYEKVKVDGEYIFRAKSSGPKRMGLLKHPSEVDGSSDVDVWEDEDADLWTVTLTINVKNVGPTAYRFFDNKVLPDIKERCAKHDWVARTRVMDCSKEMTEEGACYDVF